MSNANPFIDRFEELCREEQLVRKYGDTNYALVILDPAACPDWENPFSTSLFRLCRNDDGAFGLGGLFHNVEGKLRFSLRTGLNSVDARYNKHLILPGDFWFQGAGYHRGYWGGVSGAQEEQDWWLFCFFVDEYIKLLEAQIELLLIASRKPNRTVDEKYLLTPASGLLREVDAPMCMKCGVVMIVAGTGHACPSCGSWVGREAFPQENPS